MSVKNFLMIQWIHEYVTFVTSKNIEHWSRIQGFIHHLIQQRIPKRYSSKTYVCMFFTKKLSLLYIYSITIQEHLLQTGVSLGIFCLSHIYYHSITAPIEAA